MAVSFDPYRDWLGIQEPRSAINYYRLFRLKLFENDRTAITHAADATIARVREINTESATLGELQARLLAELAAARGCLLDPARREQYDAKLRQRLAKPDAPVPLAIPIATLQPSHPAGEPPAVSPSLWEDSGALPRRLQHAPRRSGWQGALGATLGLVLAAVVLGGIGMAVWQMQSGTDRAHSSPPSVPSAVAVAEAMPPREPVPQADPVSPDNKAHDKPPAADAADKLPSPVEEPPPPAAAPDPTPIEPPPTPAAAAAFRRAMNQTRAALVGRDLKRAAEQLALAQRYAATPDELLEAKRLAALTSQVEQFFDVVRAGLQRLAPTDEIRVGEWVAIVVERGPESLALFDEGSRRDYTLVTLPPKVVLFAARYGADEKTPQMKVATGAFQAVDPDGDRDMARRLWNEAAAAGQEVDDLLPFLDSSALEVSRDPVPEAQLASAADQRIDKEFSAAIESARSAAQKSELAIKLMAAAGDAENPVDQYALLKRGASLASSASDARLALQAADELARWFDVDALVIKSRTLSELDTQRASATTARYIARRALELADEAKSQDRGELAKSLADTALAAARKARDPELVKKVAERRREFSTPTRSPAPAAAKRSRKSASSE